MRISSRAFTDGAAIPRRFTCDGENLSPALEWQGEPAETRSFVLLCDDPDAPAGTWHHWAAYDIPASEHSLPEDAARQRTQFKQATNDFRRAGYGGPCPPHGHGVHHYHFRLLALSVERLSVPDQPTCREVEREARRHALTEATLVGVYQR
jgi:Raf kinase inhibitor-like YbhB/YbcL family protein